MTHLRVSVETEMVTQVYAPIGLQVIQIILRRVRTTCAQPKLRHANRGEGYYILLVRELHQKLKRL